MNALEIRELRHGFRSPAGRRETVIDIPEFVIAAGEQVALHGRSGSGKTTLLHLVAGVLRPDSGEIRVGPWAISALPQADADRLRATAIGYIFQTFNLLQGLSAAENIELAMRFGRGLDREFARTLLARVGLTERAAYLPRQLSSGQQQRVAIARALANHPILVLADEPTGHLDDEAATAAITMIQELCRENEAALLLVSHDPRVLDRFARVHPFAELNRANSSPRAMSIAGEQRA